jgi:ABC-type sulfate transport system substrate-binding protein
VAKIAGMGNWRRSGGWILAIGLVGLVLYYGARALWTDGDGQVHLVVYGFSTQEEALTQNIFPAFERSWETETGKDLVIQGVFGPSGTLASQIVMGSPADVAVLSNEQHANWLKAGKQVRPEARPEVVSSSPMVIVTRPGNPRAIKGYGDLAQPGLALLHADPRSSGAGDWALLAEYGSALFETKDRKAAEAQLMAIWRNVRLLGSSARASLTLFELGACDALVTYEQDARLAQARGMPLEIVVPNRTIVAEHLVVIVDSNVTRSERGAAEDFVTFLLSETGQQALSLYHLRPAGFGGGAFPPLTNPFTVADLGGWSQIYPPLVENLWQVEIEPRLDLEAAINLLEMTEE